MQKLVSSKVLGVLEHEEEIEMANKNAQQIMPSTASHNKLSDVKSSFMIELILLVDS